MYQMMDGHLCLSVESWLKAGLTRSQFEHDSKRGDLTIYRRGQHDRTLIDVWSIRRPERIAAIERAFGRREEQGKTPRATGPAIDAEAAAFFRDYTYGEAQAHLPEDTITRYTNNATIVRHLLGRLEVIRAHRNIPMGEFWRDSVAYAAEQQTKGLPNSLPMSERGFRRLVMRFKEEGYAAFVSKNYGNDTALRLEEEAREWLIARYATPVDRLTVKQLFEAYNRVARERGWKPVRSENTIRRLLDRPEVRPLWYGLRHGELKAKELFTRHHKTALPEVRDAIWYGDGTRLNYYYRDSEGRVATCCVYEVMDAYSEVLLGYHISPREDVEAQFFAYKMALQTAGRKPYEIRFDNQGGHGKLKHSDFFRCMAQLAIPTQPYNGKSKTIESVFGRFQADYLHRDWFFTGQNVTARKDESHANREFILANRRDLPSLEEIRQLYARRRQEWNEAPHPATGRRRIDMYRESQNPESTAVTALDMLRIFGQRDEEHSSKYTASGLKKTIDGQRYTWEVLTPEGLPDGEFLRGNVGRDFFVGYDPEDMTTVALYTRDSQGQLRFVTFARKYIEVSRARQEQTAEERSFISQMNLANKVARANMQEATEELLERQGMHPGMYGLRMPQLRGVERAAKEAAYKQRQEQPEKKKPAKAKAKQKEQPEDIGAVLKKETMLVPALEDDYNYLNEL
mgnify:FL=1